MDEKVLQFFAAAGGVIASFFLGLPSIIWVLVAVMSMDYITGLVCGIMGVSDKTPHGHLASSEAFKGLMRKILIILVVLLAALLDKTVTMSAGIEFAAVTGATCLWFIASEGISVLENCIKMGIKVPAVLTRALEVMKKNGDAPEESAGHPPDAQ